MKRKNLTRNALFTSILSLLLCVSMLVGTTFAWFTDEVVSGSNVITSGNLDIAVEYSLDGVTWNDLDGATDLFAKGLWEPGHTEVIALKVENKGTLALKYTANMNVVGETIGKTKTGEDIKLSDHLTVSTMIQQANAIGEAYIATVFANENAYYQNAGVKFENAIIDTEKELLPGDAHYVAIKVDMPTSVGNEANHNGINIPSIEFGVNVLAAQYTHEYDSFGKDYDAEAEYPRTAPELNPDNGTTPVEGEVYDTEQFKYTYKEAYGGWHASTANKDKTLTSYTLLESINGVPVTNLTTTFSGCTNLVEAPVLPSGATNMYQTFKNCTSLVEAPVIPSGVTTLEYTFENCTSLQNAPEIPANVTNMKRAFTNCSAMATAPSAIPANVTTLEYAFNGCKALTATPALSGATSLTNMIGAFNGCSALVNADDIPDSVTDIHHAFNGCASLEVMPKIGASVGSMNYAFENCTALTAASVIPENVTTMTATFKGCTSLTGTITINANPTAYANCFALSADGKDITLTGASTLLKEIAGYQKYRTITIQ